MSPEFRYVTKSAQTATKEISKKYTKIGLDGSIVLYEYLKVVKG